MKSKGMNGVYAPETLVMLYQVLEKSFITIVGPDQVPDLKWQEDVRIRLAQVIFAAYDHGVRNPEKLMRTAVTVVKRVHKRPSAAAGLGSKAVPFRGEHYSPENLAMMNGVLDESIALLLKRHPNPDMQALEWMRYRLAQIIRGAVAAGVDDPLELKQIALREFRTKASSAVEAADHLIAALKVPIGKPPSNAMRGRR
jgi:hypothetical protein